MLVTIVPITSASTRKAVVSDQFNTDIFSLALPSVTRMVNFSDKMARSRNAGHAYVPKLVPRFRINGQYCESCFPLAVRRARPDISTRNIAFVGRHELFRDGAHRDRGFVLKRIAHAHVFDCARLCRRLLVLFLGACGGGHRLHLHDIQLITRLVRRHLYGFVARLHEVIVRSFPVSSPALKLRWK